MAVELGLEGEGENPSGQQVRGIRKRGQHEQRHIMRRKDMMEGI